MAINTASQIIAVRAPQWAGDPREADMINLAKLWLDSTAYGRHHEYAVALMVLHIYTLEERSGGNPGSGGGTSGGSGAGGTIQSEKEGDLARQYGMSSVTLQKDSFLTQTGYGLELMRLKAGLWFKPRTRQSTIPRVS